MTKDSISSLPFRQIMTSVIIALIGWIFLDVHNIDTNIARISVKLDTLQMEIDLLNQADGREDLRMNRMENKLFYNKETGFLKVDTLAEVMNDKEARINKSIKNSTD